jgi:hypothetical protein
MCIARIIEVDAFNALLEKAYNPPTDGLRFGEEWFATQKSLMQLLLQITPKEASQIRSFTVAQDYGLSRSIEFEVHVRSFFHSELASSIWNFTRGLDPEYQIVLTHDLFICDEEADFQVCFRRNEIFAYAENMQSLSNIGISSE